MPQTLFTICFGVGAGFVILSALFGAIMGQFDSGGDASFDGAELGGDMANIDGGFDTSFDGSLDGGFDTSFDGSLDGGFDTSFDGGLDGSFDTSLDGGFDGGLDADIGSLDGAFAADAGSVGANFGTTTGILNAGAIDGGLDTDIGWVGYILGQGVSPFKPMIIATFLTIFGGIGLLLSPHWLWIFSVPMALLAGFLSAFLLFRLVYVPLHKLQSKGVVEKQGLVGLTATITESIPEGGFGKIKYVTADGNSYSAPAKSEDGNALPRGTDVQIMYIERNAFFVKTKY